MISFLVGMYAGYYASNEYEMKESSVRACFVPGENCTNLIISTIDQAKESILVQSFSFTSVPIAQALLRASRRGVKVQIILDKSNVGKRKDKAIEILKHIGNLRVDVVPGIAHNKIIIVDNKVITGSFNFTNAAQYRNAENVLVLDHDQVTKRYRANWLSRFGKSHALIE